MSHAVGRITAAEARALVQEKRRREVEINVVRYHGLVAQRIRTVRSAGYSLDTRE